MGFSCLSDDVRDLQRSARGHPAGRRRRACAISTSVSATGSTVVHVLRLVADGRPVRSLRPPQDPAVRARPRGRLRDDGGRRVARERRAAAGGPRHRAAGRLPGHRAGGDHRPEHAGEQGVQHEHHVARVQRGRDRRPCARRRDVRSHDFAAVRLRHAVRAGRCAVAGLRVLDLASYRDSAAPRGDTRIDPLLPLRIIGRPRASATSRSCRWCSS